MITEEMIKERISVINGDIEKITKDISDAEKRKPRWTELNELY